MEMRRERESAALWAIIFLCFWSSALGLLSPKGVNFEVQALMGIKSGLRDPHGVLDNWDGDAVDPCSWTMVTCSSESLVIGLGTPSQNLSGTLSPSIGNLTNLQIILLQNNNITGLIPSELGRLSKLQTLDLSNNIFSGKIPPSLGHLNSLQYMRLNNNSLSGEIPLSLADMTKLSLVDLSYNNLSGPVPRFPSKTFNIIGNSLICETGSEPQCTGGMTLIPMSMTLNTSQTAITSVKSKHRKLALAFGTSLGCIVLLVLGFGLFLWRRQRHKQQNFFDVNDRQHEEVSLGNLRMFQLRELQIATNNFSSKNILGKGGFGNVYKGFLRDGTAVAVKRLKDGSASGGERQFQTEVEMISLAVHRNLLRLYGFCMTANEKLLVYPYMSNGSVASRLKAKPVLDWGTRKRIALGAARGLLYLHEQCDPKIIHRDVKAANILLDDYCEAVVGDFGLAKLLDHQDSHVTTAVRGTVGHIAPEYLSTGQSSEKTDVFGFGILLLELITGQRALQFGKSANQKGAILDWVKKLHQGKKLEDLVDKDLKDNYDRIELEEMVQVALLCTQYLPGLRPKMSEVVRMLEGDGLAERWEASQRIESHKFKTQELSSSERYSDLTDDSSLLAQAMELSGPSYAQSDPCSHVEALEILLQGLCGVHRESLRSHELCLKSVPNLGLVSSEFRLLCDLEQPEPTWTVRHIGGAMRGAGADQISVLVRTMAESKVSKNALRLFYALGYKLDHELLRVGFAFHFHRGAHITVTVSSVNKMLKLHATDEAVPVTPGIQLVEVTAPATSENYNEVAAAVSSFCEYLAPLLHLSKPGVSTGVVPTAAAAAASLMSDGGGTTL
ncbi:hypothetical protein BUALT_Bualt04G0129300 [Buddleja alternifolia]|uniref:non-specific serine/threonine protein kinase n=1 Tax=Buddleja alternifolia TaxID=168488 RepID=A0AAV6XZC0_9LAMI|nr:hypothetical protein BUALT_Bualt04G0129300 [Buddleja alternifolia]